jgi:hypothetical protein
MATEREFTVVVPMRTSQTFAVKAISAVGAKRKVTNWLNGKRDESDDLIVIDDIGQENFRYGTRYWAVAEHKGATE